MVVNRARTCKRVSMLTLNAYIDRCKTATKSRSDNQLAIRSGLSRQAISGWRNGKAIPEEEAFLKLVRAARLDEREAIVLRNFWEASEESKSIWADVYSMLKKTSLAAILTLTLCFGGQFSTPVQAQVNDTVYYEK